MHFGWAIDDKKAVRGTAVLNGLAFTIRLAYKSVAEKLVILGKALFFREHWRKVIVPII